MTTIAADTVYEGLPSDPLQSELFLSDYVNRLVSTVHEQMDTESIVTAARLSHPNDANSQYAQVVKHVSYWFDNHVDETEFDTDVYLAAKQFVVSELNQRLISPEIEGE